MSKKIQVLTLGTQSNSVLRYRTSRGQLGHFCDRNNWSWRRLILFLSSNDSVHRGKTIQFVAGVVAGNPNTLGSIVHPQ